MQKWMEKIGLSFLGVVLLSMGLLIAHPAHATPTPNPNYSWQDMTPNLPTTTPSDGKMIFDPITQKIVAPGTSAGNYVLIDPKTQIATTITMQGPSNVKVSSSSILYASGGYVGVNINGGYFIDNELTGAYQGLAINGYNYHQDAAGNVYAITTINTPANSPYTQTMTVYKIDPATDSETEMFTCTYSFNWGRAQFFPFSDGSGFWVTYTDSPNQEARLYNSKTGITTILHAPDPYPMITLGVGGGLTNSSSYQLSDRFVGSYISGNQYFYSVSSNGSIKDTILPPGRGFSTSYPLIPVDSNTVLAYGSNNDFVVIPIDDPASNYDSGTSYGVNGNFTGSTTQYGPFSSSFDTATIVNPNTYIADTGNFATTPSNHVFALNAGAASDPVLQSITTTTSTMNVSVTNQNDVTTGLNFQFSLYKPDGTLASQSSWTGPNYTFSDLAAGTTYNLKVQSQNVFGQTSNLKDLGQFTTYPAAPTTPSATIAGAGWKSSNGEDTISVSYPAVNGATGYNVVLQDGNSILKTFDVGNITNPSITVPDDTHDSGLVDGSGKYEIAVQAYNSSNGQIQTSTTSSAVSLTPINQTDTTLPQWGSNSVTLNNGQAYTNSQAVPITINATDTDSGISKILVSNDDISWTTFNVGTSTQGMTNASNYTVTSSWQLPPGGGQKSVYVKLVDLVGNTSDIQTGFEGLQVNTTPPTVSLAINGGQSQTTSQTVTLTVTAADPAYTDDQLTMSFSSDGQTWMTPVPYQSSYNWTLPSTLSGSYPVFVRVSDPAANTGLAYSSIYYLNSTTAPTIGNSGATGGTIGGSYPVTNYDGISNVYVTKANQVSLDFSQSGASYVSVSTDNISFSSLYDATKPFTIQLPAGDGLKTIYAQLANAKNQAALGSTGKIYFLVDTTDPTLYVSTIGNATVTTGSSFQVQLNASDNTTALTSLQYQVNGGPWSSIPSNQMITISGFQPHSGLQTYTVTVRDLAGNTVQKNITFWAI